MAMELPFINNGPVVVSTSDDREYRCITLSNKLQVLIIHDKETDKASAAMDVNVGSLCDPENAMGIAHFCEHMLFLGTEKYPDENSYSAFLSAHGGSSNAYTDQDHTNYFFDVNQEHLEGALDRFSQFFISPLFTESATDREMQAVDSEHHNYVQVDFWRTFQLYKSLARKDHPFNKFSTGNLTTLKELPLEQGVDIKAELMKFHSQYYSSNLMRLVVLGRQPLDELQEMVLSKFSAIPCKDVPVPVYPGEPYGPSEIPKHLSVVPVKDSRIIEIAFPLPPIREHYRSKPLNYICHLIGHEGAGSILALLKAKGWANELSAGATRNISDWSSLSIRIDATILGMEHMWEIVQIVFQYITMIRQQGPQRWIFEETQTIAENSFRFKSKQQPMNYTCSLAHLMQLYPAEHVVCGSELLFDYEPETIQHFINFLTPQRMLLMALSKEYEGSTDQIEKWYETKYSVTNLKEETLAMLTSNDLHPELRLPDKNDFIATDFELKPVPESPKLLPYLLRNTPTCLLWFKQDNVFKKPKANIIMKIDTPIAYESAEGNVLTRLLVQMIKERLNQYSYMAEVAGLYYSMEAVRQGILVEVSGFNQKLNVLLVKVLEQLASFSADDAPLFERLKEKEIKALKNQVFQQPYTHAMVNAFMCLEQPRFGYQEKLEAAMPLTTDNLQSFARRFLLRFNLEILLHGNFTPEDALAVCDQIETTLKPQRGPLPEGTDLEARVVKVAENTSYLFRCKNPDPENANSAIQIIYQVGPETLDQTAKLELLCHLLKEPAFNQLRTQECLGYIIWSGQVVVGENVQGVRFIIQSEQKDPVHLESRIEAFIQTFDEILSNMTPEAFQENVKAVKEQILEKDKNLNEESNRYWKEIQKSAYHFDRNQALAALVESLTQETIVQFYRTYVVHSSTTRMKLSSQIFGSSHALENPDECDGSVVLIKSASAFRRSMPLYPLSPRVDLPAV